MFGPLLDTRGAHPELERGAERAWALMNRVLASGLRRTERRPAPQYVRSGVWALVHGLSVLAIDGQLDVDRKDIRALSRLTRAALEAFERVTQPA